VGILTEGQDGLIAKGYLQPRIRPGAKFIPHMDNRADACGYRCPPVTTSASLTTLVTMPTEGSAASTCLEAGKVEAPKIMRKRAAQAICQTPRERSLRQPRFVAASVVRQCMRRAPGGSPQSEISYPSLKVNGAGLMT
jgi:hypothetical protein